MVHKTDPRLRVHLHEDCVSSVDVLRNINNTPLTIALFYETRNNSCLEKNDAPYTLKKRDMSDTCKSAYLIFMSCRTVYEGAMKLVGDWSHWGRLINHRMLSVELDFWIQEMLIKQKSMVYEALFSKVIKEGSPSAATALSKLFWEKGEQKKPVDRTVRKIGKIETDNPEESESNVIDLSDMMKTIQETR